MCTRSATDLRNLPQRVSRTKPAVSRHQRRTGNAAWLLCLCTGLRYLHRLAVRFVRAGDGAAAAIATACAVCSGYQLVEYCVWRTRGCCDRRSTCACFVGGHTDTTHAIECVFVYFSLCFWIVVFLNSYCCFLCFVLCCVPCLFASLRCTHAYCFAFLGMSGFHVTCVSSKPCCLRTQSWIVSLHTQPSGRTATGLLLFPNGTTQPCRTSMRQMFAMLSAVNGVERVQVYRPLYALFACYVSAQSFCFFVTSCVFC